VYKGSANSSDPGDFVTKADRVDLCRSCVVGALEGSARGESEEKPVMDHKTMQFSWKALDRIRSWWKATQSTIFECTSDVEKCG